MQIRIIGFDSAKHVFQVHAADAEGRTVAQVRLRRAHGGNDGGPVRS